MAAQSERSKATHREAAWLLFRSRAPSMTTPEQQDQGEWRTRHSPDVGWYVRHDERHKSGLDPDTFYCLTEEFANITAAYLNTLTRQLEEARRWANDANQRSLIYERRAIEAERQLEVAKEGLAFYADRTLYFHNDGMCSPACADEGDTARATLRALDPTASEETT